MAQRAQHAAQAVLVHGAAQAQLRPGNLQFDDATARWRPRRRCSCRRRLLCLDINYWRHLDRQQDSGLRTAGVPKMVSAPLEQHVGVDATSQRDGRHRSARLQALPYKVLFESQVVLPATGLANLRITLHGVHHLP
ncbi:hypothetical protein ASF44_24185 [Pseudorhodoferax sp. Leaf274]|nr:hypothetical protein ASF44_24185 [Pseudorhodoferax sp. Leaf274]